jgi:hypothetical protein
MEKCSLAGIDFLHFLEEEGSKVTSCALEKQDKNE